MDGDKRSKLTITKEDKSKGDRSTSVTQVQSTSSTNVPVTDADFYTNLTDRENFPNLTFGPMLKRGLYSSGATSLPLDLNNILQTENVYDLSEGIGTDRPTDAGFEITIPNDERVGACSKGTFVGAPDEKCRNVIGQETTQQTPISRRIAVESAPRERKKWVRPPLVGQSTSDSAAASYNNSSLDAVTADKLQDPKVEQTSSSSENIRSLLTLVKLDNLQPCKPKTFANIGISSDIQNSYSYFTPTILGSAVQNDMHNRMLTKPHNSYNTFISGNSPVSTGPFDNHSQGQETIALELDVTGTSSCGRAPSPASVSSVTSSRRLEWDSGADVGYQAYQSEDAENIRKKDLSTLEQIALARGPAPFRVEPEGFDGSVQDASALPPSNIVSFSNSKLIAPVAVSTPIDSEIIAVSGTDSESEIMPIVRLHRGSYFFPSEKNDSAASSSKEDVKTAEAEASSDVLSRKISSSLTDLSECGMCEEKHKNSNSLPRSQSHLNLMLEHNHKQKISTVSTSSCPLPLRFHLKQSNGRSASSSSIATVVPKYESPRTSDKRTQTSVCNTLDRNSIGIQVCETHYNDMVIAESDLGEEDSDSDIINNTENNIDNERHIIHLRGTYSKSSNYRPSCLTEEFSQKSIVDVNKKRNTTKQLRSLGSKSDTQSSNKLLQTNGANEKCTSTIESRASSAGSWVIGDAFCSVNGNLNGGARRDSSGVVGSANSFEYLPGHIYENNADKTVEKEDSSSQSDLLSENELKTLVFGDDSEFSSLKKDLHKGLTLLNGLIKSKCYSSSFKKKLVRLLVNRIVETDYAEDSVSVQSKDQSDPKPQQEGKIMVREEISGESAGEQQPSVGKPQVKPHGQMQSSEAYFTTDKCVGTDILEPSASSSTTERTCHSDTYTNSRMESTTTGSSSINTISSGKGSWKEFATQSEREYEYSKHPQGYKSVLLKVCETERENQLSWISTEINHLSNLKLILEKKKVLSKGQERRGSERPKRSPKKVHRCHSSMISHSGTSSIQDEHKKNDKDRKVAEGRKYPETLKPSDLHTQELLKNSQNGISMKKKDVSSQIPSTSDSEVGTGKTNSAVQNGIDSLLMSNFSTLEMTTGALSDGTTGRINVFAQTVKKPNEIKEKDALCCCECKKLLCRVKAGGEVRSRRDLFRNFRAAETSNGSCTTSSSGTLRGSFELNSDGKGQAKMHLKPHSDSALTHKKRNVFETHLNATEEKCPCCGCVEEAASSQLASDDWKCARYLDQMVRKCHLCGVSVKKNALVPNFDVTWKCDNCLKRKTNKCLRCGKEQPIVNENEAEHQNSVSAPSRILVDKSSVGYILTLESPTISDSSVSALLKEPLQEIKMKVPSRKKFSFSSNEKGQEKSKKGTLGSKSSSKENKTPERSPKHKSRSQKEARRFQERYYTLQEYLVANRPDFIRNAEYRRQCLDEIVYLRELRQKSKHKILAIASHPNIEAETNTEMVFPPPLAVTRIFSQRSMRAQTERKYHKLPEVLSKKAERKRKEDYRTNRLMAEVFAKKLQKKVLKGEVNLSNSRNVITLN